MAYVALWVAGKYFEEYSVVLRDLVSMTQGRFTPTDFLEAEEHLVTTLHFRLVRRSPPAQVSLTKSSLDSVGLKQLLGSPDYAMGRVRSRRSARH